MLWPIWVDLGYAPAAHVLILFSVPCIVLRVEPSQKHTFFCPLSGGVIFFGGGFLVQKLHPKNWFHKSGVPPLNPIFLRSAHRAQQMEMTVRKSTFQGFRQVYIVGGARYRKPFKKNQTDFLPEMANYVNVQGIRSLLLQPFEEGEKWTYKAEKPRRETEIRRGLNLTENLHPK